MTIKIAHLYYDLMNLYGENANIRALKAAFERQNVNVEIHFLTIGDEINFNDYDIFYIGCGTEKYQLLVLEDLKKYKLDIKKSIDNNKYFFMTGNALELFGSHIIDFNKKRINALHIFEYYTKIMDIENYTEEIKFRITGEVLLKSKLIDKLIIGFQNRCGTLYNVKSPLFSVVKGCGNFPNDINEGFTYNNFYGTYTIGPLFMRNPYLTEYFVKKILDEKDLPYSLIDTSSEIDAYNEYLNNFVDQTKIEE